MGRRGATPNAEKTKHCGFAAPGCKNDGVCLFAHNRRELRAHPTAVEDAVSRLAPLLNLAPQRSGCAGAAAQEAKWGANSSTFALRPKPEKFSSFSPEWSSCGVPPEDESNGLSQPFGITSFKSLDGRGSAAIWIPLKVDAACCQESFATFLTMTPTLLLLDKSLPATNVAAAQTAEMMALESVLFAFAPAVYED